MTKDEASLRNVSWPGRKTAFGKFPRLQHSNPLSPNRFRPRSRIRDGRIGQRASRRSTRDHESGILPGQHSVRGGGGAGEDARHAARAGLNGIPLNQHRKMPCASGSTALNQRARGRVRLCRCCAGGGCREALSPDKQRLRRHGQPRGTGSALEIFAETVQRRGSIVFHGCLRESSRLMDRTGHPGRLRLALGQEPRPRCA